MKNTVVRGLLITYDNESELRGLVKEIFEKNSYWIDLDNDKPRILDIGAHIGLATLYFKKTYPQASIVALEPIGDNFQLLNKNIKQSDLDDVEVKQLAVSTGGGKINLYKDSSADRWYSVAGVRRGAWDGSQESEKVVVDSVRLSELLKGGEWDLVKLDIEGAELKVIKEAFGVLGGVRNFLVEYHPVEGNDLLLLLRLLERAGFKTSVWGESGEVDPRKWNKLAIVKGVR